MNPQPPKQEVTLELEPAVYAIFQKFAEMIGYPEVGKAIEHLTAMTAAQMFADNINRETYRQRYN